MIKPKKNIEIEGASVECALDAICGKWKGVIIYNLLKFEVLRFGELQKNLKNLEISSGQWSPNNYMASHRLFSHPWLPVAHQSPRQLQQPLAAVCENWARIISL